MSLFKISIFAVETFISLRDILFIIKSALYFLKVRIICLIDLPMPVPMFKNFILFISISFAYILATSSTCIKSLMAFPSFTMVSF